MLNKYGIFGAGVLFGTAGLKLLCSKDAQDVYAQVVAGALRCKDCLMKTVYKIQVDAEDIYANAKKINRQREEVQEQEILKDTSKDETK